MDYAIAHRDGQERVVALVRSLDEARLHTIVPLNPAWRVPRRRRDTWWACARTPSPGTSPTSPIRRGSRSKPGTRDDWTQAQVERAARSSVRGRARRVGHAGSPVGGSARTGPGRLRLRRDGPLGRSPRRRLSPARSAPRAAGTRRPRCAVTTMAFAITRGWLGLRLDRASLPGMLMRTTGVSGSSDTARSASPSAGDRFDLFRSITGRRSQPRCSASTGTVTPPRSWMPCLRTRSRRMRVIE
jgi:hypothetical protein